MDENFFEMEMPTPCRSCGEIFDLNDGYESEKWFRGIIICEECHEKEEDEIDEDERWQQLNEDLSNALFSFSEEKAWDRLSDDNLSRIKEIPVLVKLQIERTDRYWHYCGRNNRQFVETTYWYNSITQERTETTRSESFFPSEEWNMPEWCKGITEHRSRLDAQYY